MLKRLCRIGVSLAVALNSFSVVLPAAFAEGDTSQQTIEDCTFEIQTNYKTIQKGTQYKLNLVNFTGKTVEWTSNNQDVATVDDNGVITAREEGNAVIEAKTTEGTNNVINSKTCYVTVYERKPGVSITPAYVTGKQTEGSKVIIDFETFGGINKSDVTWTTSNKWCCTVDNGVAVFTGNQGNLFSVITATAEKDGVTYSDSCAVYATKSVGNSTVGMKDYYSQQYTFTKDAAFNNKNQLIQYMYYDNAEQRYIHYPILTTGNGRNFNNGDKKYGYVSDNSIVCGENGEGAFAFKAPYDGNVNVALNYGVKDGFLAGDAWNYADVGIYLNNEQKYFCDVSEITDKKAPPTISSTDGSHKGLDIQVKAGDYVYIRAMMPSSVTTSDKLAILKAWYEAFEFNFTRSDNDSYINAPQSIDAGAGETVKLNAAASKENSVIKYASSDTSVAAVDENGTVDVKNDQMGKSCKIYSVAFNNDMAYAGTVTEINVNDNELVLSSDYKRIAVGESFILKGIMKAEAPYETDITLSLKDSQNDIVSIDGNTVNALKPGTTVVTAKHGNKKAICAVEVYDPKLYFEENFFEISGTGADDAEKGLKGEAKLNLKGTLADNNVSYTCYASKWMKEWGTDGSLKGDMYQFNTEDMTVKAKNGAYGMIEIIAKSGDVTATATIMVGGCAYGTYETAYVTGTELLKGYDDNIENVVLPANYANHYLWKYGYASYGVTDYTLMNKYNKPGIGNDADRATVSGSGNSGDDYWTLGSVHMPSDNKTSFRLNPGRYGSQATCKDVILVFRAPKSGKIKVNVGVNDNEIEINRCNMPFKVIQKNQVVYDYRFDNPKETITNPTGFKDHFATKTLDVQKGEEILFTLAYDSVNGNYWLTPNINVKADKSLFNITYDSITKESAADAHNITLVPGEEYDFSDITAGTAVSLNDDIVSVIGGKIKANMVGKTEVCILDAQGKKTTLNVSVKSLSVKKSADGNSVTVKGGKCSNGIVYAAEYADGRLLNVKTQATNADNITSFNMMISGNNTVKAFMWDENLKPKCYSENLENL